jgi:polyhydroxybutyrate depolymerase
MIYTLVAEKPDVFKAAASVIGTMSGHTWENRDSIRPVPILQVSSLYDEVIPYDGSMAKFGGVGCCPTSVKAGGFCRDSNAIAGVTFDIVRR